MRVFISMASAVAMIVMSAGSLAAGIFTFLAVWVLLSSKYENNTRISTQRRYLMRETNRRNRRIV